MDLNWIDYSILGIVVFSTLISLVRGFVREVFSLIIWAGALWIAYKCAGMVADQFLNNFEAPGLRYPLAFFIVFLLVLIVGAILSYAIGRLVYQTGLSGTDRVLGLAFGLTRGVLLVGVLLLAAALTNLNQHPAWAQSKMLPQFSGLVNWLYAMLPEKIDAFAKIAEKEAQKKLGLNDSSMSETPDSEKANTQPTAGAASTITDPLIESMKTTSIAPAKTSTFAPDNNNFPPTESTMR